MGAEGRLEFWGAAKPQALQQCGWGLVGHMEMLRGRGDDGIYVVGVKDSARADASKPDLISGKELFENCDNSIPVKETQSFSMFEAVPKAEQRDWKKRKKLNNPGLVNHVVTGFRRDMPASS